MTEFHPLNSDRQKLVFAVDVAKYPRRAGPAEYTVTLYTPEVQDAEIEVAEAPMKIFRQRMREALDHLGFKYKEVNVNEELGRSSRPEQLHKDHLFRVKELSRSDAQRLVRHFLDQDQIELDRDIIAEENRSALRVLDLELPHPRVAAAPAEAEAQR